MKSYVIIGVFFVCATTLGGQRNTTHLFESMSAQEWVEDIDFIMEKVEAYFVSADPMRKTAFLEALDSLKVEEANWSSGKIIVKLVYLFSRLGDAHSNLNILFDGVSVFDKVPIAFYAFEEEWFIVSAHPEYEELLGSKVVGIGELKMEEVVNGLMNFLPADNEMEVWANGGLLMQMPAVLFELGIIEQPDGLPLVFQAADGQLKQCEVLARPVRQLSEGPVWKTIRSSVSDTPSFMEKGTHYFYHYFEEEDLFYCFYGRTQDQEGRPKLKEFFREMFKELDSKKPSRLLIDLRNNSGGDYKKSEPLIKGLEKRMRVGEPIEVFAVTSRHTYSAAVVTAALLKKKVDAVLIGEPGRSSPNQTDDASFWKLPNSGLKLGLTVKLKEHLPEIGNLRYLPVDVPISVSLDEFRAGKDLVWEYFKK